MSARLHRRGTLFASLLALLPFLGAGGDAVQAVRDGNTRYLGGDFDGALERYAAAAERVPGSPEIALDRGNVWFRRNDPDKALELWMQALGATDPALRAQAKYDIGVVRLKKAVAARDTPAEALSLTHTAVRYFREALDLDRGLVDARYNLELAYRFAGTLEHRLQDSPDGPPLEDEAYLRRGMALQNLIRNEGAGRNDKAPDSLQQTRSEQKPEHFDAENHGQERNDRPLPVAMGAEAAAELMERLLEEIRTAEAWRQKVRRAALQAPGEQEPW